LGRALLVGLVCALVFADAASAAIFLHVTQSTVQRGGRLHLRGNASAMSLYVLPLARASSCVRLDTCATLMRRRKAPSPPFVRVGRTPGTTPGFAATHSFVVRLPGRIPVGRYRLFVWCVPCGGTLIPATAGTLSQTLRVVS
jgi:hypothetical protein